MFAKRVSALILFTFCLVGSLFAQQCLDTNYYVPPIAICLNDFDPVCGCDGVTYKNYDCAYRQAGVLHYQLGPCGSLATNHYPDPATGLTPFKVQIVNRYEDDINIEIKNLNGTLFLADHYSGLTELEVTYSVSGYPRGLYFLFIYNSTEFQVRKFMVWEP
jgi:hypothetical protein